MSDTDFGRCFTTLGTKTLSPSETNRAVVVPSAGEIRAPAGLLSTPSVGRFASSAPNAIGMSNSGSNSLNTARYMSTATTPHITIIRQSTYRNPVSQARSIKLFIIVRQSVGSYFFEFSKVVKNLPMRAVSIDWNANTNITSKNPAVQKPAICQMVGCIGISVSAIIIFSPFF